MNRQEFLRRVSERRGHPEQFLFLPEDADRNPDGYCVIADRGDVWEAWRDDRGKQEMKTFGSESEALEYAFNQWVDDL